MTGAAEHPDVTEISDLTEGLLTPARSEEIHRHLESCADCRDVHASLEEIRGLLGTLPPSTPMPVDVAERIDAALAAEALLAATAPEDRTVGSSAEPVTPPEIEGLAETGALASASGASVHDENTELDAQNTTRPGRKGSHVSRETSKASSGDRPAGRAKGTTGPGRGGRRAGRRRVVALGAVFTVAALGLGGLLFQVVGGQDDDGSQTTAENQHKGTTFSDSTMESRVGKLLDGEKAAPSPKQSTPSFDVKSSPDAPSDAPLRQELPAVKIPSCVEKGIGRKNAPLAAEQGTYQGKPAYLVVLPHPSDAKQVSAYVVDASCVDQGKTASGEILSTDSYARR
ncbi:zf-HC2 domain-containing protein [Streptomyces physcomitrii]|uniref:anti-sigma factor family protein n=1 Tax=Streptomyces physcomitrii TaxID=2724184 RepID=UPI00341B9762